MRVAPISPDEAGLIIFDDWVYSRIADDESPDKEELILPDDVTYLGGYKDDELIGVFTLHDTDLGQTCHFQVLKDKRQYADELGDMFLEHVEGDVYGRIPTLYPRVIEFAKRHGFVDVRIEKDSFMKDGKNYDRHIMVRKCPS